MQPMIGTVESIKFTHSGCQLTTIDGVCYATHWDARKLPVFAGRRVEYVRRGRMHWAFSDAEEADIIRVLPAEGGVSPTAEPTP